MFHIITILVTILTGDGEEVLHGEVLVYKKIELQKQISRRLSIRIAFPAVNDAKFFEIIQHEDYGRASYVLDLACPQARKILKQDITSIDDLSNYCNIIFLKFSLGLLRTHKIQQSAITGQFRFIHSWLTINDKPMLDSEIRHVFSGIRLRADMNVKVAIPEPSANRYDIFEVYKLGLGVETVIRRIGIFQNKTYMYIGKRRTFYESRKNMSGVLIRNTNTADYSFETDEDLAKNYQTRETGNHGKFYFKIYRNLIDIHQFHYNTTIQKEWFGNTTNGNDGGFGKLLFDDTVDFNSAGGILRPARMHVYDFVLPYTDYKSCFFYRNLDTATSVVNVLKPFTVRSWYALVGIGIVICLAIKVALWIDYAFLRCHANYSIFTAVVTTVSVFAQQGTPIVPDLIGGRLIFIILHLISIIIYNYYTSSLVSSLLSSDTNSLTTIEELAESNLRVGIENTPYAITYILQQKENEAVQKLNSTKLYEVGIPNFLSPADGIASVKNGGFAYNTDAITAYPLIAKTFEAHQICELAQISFVTPGYLGLMLQKKSQYSELMKISLTVMLSSGIVNREDKFWNPRNPECVLNAIIRPVGVNELVLVYLIILTGVIISLLLFSIEMIWYSLFEDDH